MINESILNSVKKALGLPAESSSFDQDIIMHINSVFVILNQLGVGTSFIFSISGESEKWIDFIPQEKAIELVKSYMYLRVRMLFDPPDRSNLSEVYQRQINEFEWRLNVLVDPSKL